MLTLLLYVLIVGLVAALLFLVASAVFGRGEELGPLPEGTTVTVLPATGIRGADVRALRFQQVFRGYKAGEVDWALSRLAARIEELEAQLTQRNPSTGDEEPYGPAPQPPGTSGIGPDADPPGPATNATAVGWPGPASEFPAPFGSAPSGFGGLPGAPGIAPPFPGTGQVPPFGTGIGGDPLGSAGPNATAYPAHPFASGNGFGTPPADPVQQGPTLPGSAWPGSTAPHPAPDLTPSGPIPSPIPPTAAVAAATTAPDAPNPPAPAASGPDPAVAGPGPVAGNPDTGGFTEPADTGTTGSWAPPPLPSDPHPGPGGVR